MAYGYAQEDASKMDILRAIVNQFRLTWALLRDPRVPFWAKLVPFLGILYVVSPIDIIPDVLIGIGQLDDLGVIIASLKLFETLTDSSLVAAYRASFGMRGDEADQIMKQRRRNRLEDDPGRSSNNAAAGKIVRGSVADRTDETPDR